MENVSVGLTFRPDQMIITPTGVVFDKEFMQKLCKKKDFFEYGINKKINEFAGGDWEVHFGEYPAGEDEKYIVDIATTNYEFIRRIAGVISNSFPEIKFSFYVKGQHSPFDQTPFFMN